VNSTRRLRWLFGGGVLVLAAVLAWVSALVLRLEGAEEEARVEAVHQGQVRLALWRMDSWLTPLLAREAARPYFEYSAYYPHERAYTRMLQPLDAGEVLTASPLLTFASDIFTLHFQVSPDDSFSSPQAPQGRQLELAQGTFISPEAFRSNETRLQALREGVSYEQLSKKVQRVDNSLVGRRGSRATTPPQPRWVQTDPGDGLEGPQKSSPANQEPEPPQDTKASQEAQWARNVYELGKRAQQADQTTSNNIDIARIKQPLRVPTTKGGQPAVVVGPLVPTWLDDGGLLYVREVVVGGKQLLQGFRVDWPALRDQLLDEVQDLVPDARLQEIRSEGTGREGLELATVPARLVTTTPVAAVAIGMSPVRWALVLGWLAAALAVGAVGHTVRASLALGERRSRFASSVTHELRTPLTTFRMYSEMLADGMVTDEARRQEYLETLRDESDRLSRLVENVLSYAQLEEGRLPLERERSTVDELLASIRPTLERRAADGGMEFLVDTGSVGQHAVETDATAVGQVLFNLVDNATKYAGAAADRRIELGAQLRDGRLVLSVRDHGPGVQPEARATIFEAFERRAPDALPGVGLGLALSRGLARTLSGELVLDETCTDGGRFELVLPA